mmetsp:Transcript_24079/g.18363  ORF Transcript_24079/g.18363 Transcript_24079/m.18363 type:complete len:102 (-) Transcript_24079:412-717(-)
MKSPGTLTAAAASDGLRSSILMPPVYFNTSILIPPSKNYDISGGSPIFKPMLTTKSSRHAYELSQIKAQAELFVAWCINAVAAPMDLPQKAILETLPRLRR